MSVGNLQNTKLIIIISNVKGKNFLYSPRGKKCIITISSVKAAIYNVGGYLFNVNYVCSCSYVCGYILVAISYH